MHHKQNLHVTRTSIFYLRYPPTFRADENYYVCGTLVQDLPSLAKINSYANNWSDSFRTAKNTAYMSGVKSQSCQNAMEINLAITQKLL